MALSKDDLLNAIAEMSVMEVVELIRTSITTIITTAFGQLLNEGRPGLPMTSSGTSEHLMTA